MRLQEDAPFPPQKCRLAEAGLHEGVLHRLEGVEVVAGSPDHEVRFASQDHVREGAQEHGTLVFLDSPQEVPLPQPTLLLEESAPQDVELEEEVEAIP